MIQTCINHPFKPANKNCSNCRAGLCKWCNYGDREKELCERCAKGGRKRSYNFITTKGLGDEDIIYTE